jgi:hypothetical protein
MGGQATIISPIAMTLRISMNVRPLAFQVISLLPVWNSSPFDIRLACTKCERRGQYRKTRLLERYGPNANMVDWRLTLAGGCPKIAG